MATIHILPLKLLGVLKRFETKIFRGHESQRKDRGLAGKNISRFLKQPRPYENK